jgi:hypothetical protein
MADLCIGFYGGEGHGTHMHEPLEIVGCSAHAKGEINAWIAKNKGFEADGLSCNLNNLVGMEHWTTNASNCLDIKEMGNIATIERDDLKLEDAGPDSDSDSDPAFGAE